MRKVAWLALVMGGVATATFSACGSDDGSVFDGGPDQDGSGGNDSTTGTDTGGGGDGCTGPFCSFDGTTPDTGTKPCTGLCLKQVTCPPGDAGKVTTTLS